ncbi:hypothetical protein D3C78_1448920 [compost metagenome]
MEAKDLHAPWQVRTDNELGHKYEHTDPSECRSPAGLVKTRASCFLLVNCSLSQVTLQLNIQFLENSLLVQLKHFHLSFSPLLRIREQPIQTFRQEFRNGANE